MNAQSSSSSSSMGLSHLNSTFDPEIDSFLDLEPTNFSTQPSPAVGKAIPTPAQRPAPLSSSTSFASSHSSQGFSGPSFQYESYKQQTGLPIGGLANTFALNRSSGLEYNSNTGFVMPSDTLNVPLSSMDDLDFGRTPSLSFNDMDFDVDESPSDLPAMFYPSSSTANQDDSPTYSAPFQRMYPGMHSQQAAQAKAQQAQKQQEMVRQQQQQQQRAMAAAGQRPLPSSNGKAAQKDPVVEESISRLLNQMRQNSVASLEDDADTPTNGSFHTSRRHKDEDDMDEDERLLASEEGKKLSSKERRQLRNKVSARAFRSRRKEYIGQLEGEINARTQEASDLKVQNKQLMEENARLTDLTRMLLSSPSFSGFLEHLSTNGMSTQMQSALSQNQAAPTVQPVPKDVNPSQASRQIQSQQPQVGMALLPESATDFSALNTPFDSWNSGMSDFQVYSVTDLPHGPVLDINKLSGKAEATDSTIDSSSSAKDMPKKVEQPLGSLPVTSPVVNAPVVVDPTVELDREAFDLYFDSPSTTPTTTATTDLQLPTKSSNYALVVDSHGTEDNLRTLRRMCAALDATCERLALMTPHL